jgi:hypothetical protein
LVPYIKGAKAIQQELDLDGNFTPLTRPMSAGDVSKVENADQKMWALLDHMVNDKEIVKRYFTYPWD